MSSDYESGTWKGYHHADYVYVVKEGGTGIPLTAEDFKALHAIYLEWSRPTHVTVALPVTGGLWDEPQVQVAVIRELEQNVTRMCGQNGWHATLPGEVSTADVPGVGVVVTLKAEVSDADD